MNGIESIHITVFPILNTPGDVLRCRDGDGDRPKVSLSVEYSGIFDFFPEKCQLYTSNWTVAGEYHYLLSGTYGKLS